MAAMVASPIPGKIPLYLEVRVALDTIGNLLFKRIYVSIEIGNMFPYRVLNGGVGRTEAVEFLGTHGDQGIDSPYQHLELSHLGRSRCPGFRIHGATEPCNDTSIKASSSP